ncbi:hypothetical protein Hanom_Chr15g01373541 [Helianthus anomalus]
MVTMAKSPQANDSYSSGKPPQVNLFLKLLNPKSTLHSLLLQIPRNLKPKSPFTRN